MAFRFVFKRDFLEKQFVQLDLAKAEGISGERVRVGHSWGLDLTQLDPCHLLRVWNIYETPRDHSCPAFNSLRGYHFSVLFLCDVPSPLFHNHMLSWMRTNRMSVREHLWSKKLDGCSETCKVKRCDRERCNLQHVDIGNMWPSYVLLGNAALWCWWTKVSDASSRTTPQWDVWNLWNGSVAEVRDGDDLGLLERSL